MIWIIFIIGIFLTSIPAIHGTARRYLDKDFVSVRKSNFVLYFSGFLVAIGGFLEGWLFLTLWYF